MPKKKGTAATSRKRIRAGVKKALKKKGGTGAIAAASVVLGDSQFGARTKAIQLEQLQPAQAELKQAAKRKKRKK